MLNVDSQDNYQCNTRCIEWGGLVKVKIENFLTPCSQADEEIDINMQIEENT